MDAEPLYVSVADAAKLAGIGVNEFRDMMRRPDAPVLRIGTRTYVERAGIAGFLRNMQENQAFVARQGRA